METIDKEISTLGTNIKSVLTRQDTLEAEQAELKEAVNGMNAKANRLTLAGDRASFQSEFSRALTSQQDNIAKMAKKELKEFSFDIKAVGNMSYGVNFANAAVSVGTFRDGVIGAPARPTHIRDLLPFGTMAGANFVYLKETGVQGAPTTVAEAGTKPQIDFSLTEVTLPAQVIAAWLVISNQMLDDVSSLNVFLNNRLLERLLVVEDNQLLSGSGTSPNLSGINTAGNFTAATGIATIDIEQLVQAIAQLAGMSRQASGIILNPADYYAIALNKATTSGDYSLPPVVTVSETGTVKICGIPVIWTAEQAVGTFTVGDFNNGTALLSRWSPRIEFFTDSTLAKNNQTMIRIEERIAFAVFGSTFIVKGTF